MIISTENISPYGLVKMRSLILDVPLSLSTEDPFSQLAILYHMKGIRFNRTISDQIVLSKYIIIFLSRIYLVIITFDRDEIICQRIPWAFFLSADTWFGMWF